MLTHPRPFLDPPDTGPQPVGAPQVPDLERLTRDNLDGQEITIGAGVYLLKYLRPAREE